MTTNLITERELDQRLRRTLRAVADTVETVETEPAAVANRPRSGRRALFGLGAVAIAVPLAAGAIIRIGPEYVDKIPPDDVIVAQCRRRPLLDGRGVPPR
ncbi:MAG: hypothetical protein ACR2HA_04095 [Nocardioides sp.]